MEDKYAKVMTATSITDIHLTQDYILDFSRKLLQVEQFDLDVANTTHNNTNSKRYYTEENSALYEQNSWESSALWCNPPFSKNKQFSQKLVRELPKIEQGVWLSKCDCRPTWARILIDVSVGVIFKKGYVRFSGVNQNAPFGIVLYLFNNVDLDNASSLCESSKDFTLFRK